MTQFNISAQQFTAYVNTLQAEPSLKIKKDNSNDCGLTGFNSLFKIIENNAIHNYSVSISEVSNYKTFPQVATWGIVKRIKSCKVLPVYINKHERKCLVRLSVNTDNQTYAYDTQQGAFCETERKYQLLLNSLRSEKFSVKPGNELKYY